MPIYAREGVSHVWLVDPLAQLLEVLRLDGATHRLIAARTPPRPPCAPSRSTRSPSTSRSSGPASFATSTMSVARCDEPTVGADVLRCSTRR
ncbi:MAG: hypothetical protein U0235_14090 [Polyangiaceae bacterium]